jgi:hypothetical protein
MRIRIKLFYSMRFRIQLFTSMRIRIQLPKKMLIRGVADPGCLSRNFFPSRISDPGSELSPSRAQIRIEEFKYLNPKKKWFLSSRKYDPGCSSRIPDPDADFLPIPDPGSRGQKGTGSRIRIRNTADPDPAQK